MLIEKTISGPQMKRINSGRKCDMTADDTQGGIKCRRDSSDSHVIAMQPCDSKIKMLINTHLYIAIPLTN